MAKAFDLLDLNRLKARTALLAIGASTLRNQGAPGVVEAARKYLAAIGLCEFSVESPTSFQKVLDEHTDLLRNRFPRKARKSWGGARKALNIFLRDVFYNRFLCEHYQFETLAPWLELPLDSNTYDGLAKDPTRKSKLPKWSGVKGLKSDVSDKLQTIAAGIADGYRIFRVHLDVKYWRSAAIDGLSD